MNGRRVMIVEDEQPAREMLRAFPWEVYGCRLAAEADNGEEALARMDAAKPDILVTDVMMPVMDGLTLVREVKRRHPRVQVILLTCYGDYPYVREALILGAVDYLLKGVYRDEELGAALRKADAALGRAGGEPHASAPPEEWPDRASVPIPSRLIHLRWTAESGLPDGGRDEWLDALSGQVPHTRIFAIGSRELLLFAPEREEARCIRLVERLAEADAGRSRRVLWCAVIGKRLQDADSWEPGYALSRSVMPGAFYYDGPVVLDVQRSAAVSPLRHDEWLSLTLRMKETLMNRDAFREFIESELPRFLREWLVHPDDVKLLLGHWAAEWRRSGLPVDADALKAAIRAADRCGRLLAETLQALQRFAVHHPTDLRIEIEQAMLLVQERLASPFTAVDIAELVGLSPKYFGILFKKQTGESFQDYVKRIRMEKAAQLLRTTGLKIYEVAEQVGIPNYRYFTDVFSRHFGKSPRSLKGHGHAED